MPRREPWQAKTIPRKINGRVAMGARSGEPSKHRHRSAERRGRPPNLQANKKTEKQNPRNQSRKQKTENRKQKEPPKGPQNRQATKSHRNKEHEAGSIMLEQPKSPAAQAPKTRKPWSFRSKPRSTGEGSQKQEKRGEERERKISLMGILFIVKEGGEKL
ncbi:hypothetical protein SLE2022_207820 [Rubroshorea leprosula]